MTKTLIHLAMVMWVTLIVKISARQGPIRRTLAETNSCSLFTKQNYTLLMVADPGTFSGTPEAVHYEESLQNNFSIPIENLLCPRITVGELMGQPTIVATSGIGPTTAALCVIDLMRCVGPKIKELIYTGTSGWSSAVGGILNADNCKKANPTHRIARLGDVCVSPLSINWSCKLADWVGQAEGYPGMCFLPIEEDGPAVASLYGDCVFDTHTKGSLGLADEILTAAHGTNSLLKAPLRNTIIEDNEILYWDYQRNATGRHYNLDKDDPPMVWNYKTCAEVDSQFFFSGVPWEMTARNYTALVINTAFNSSLTAHDVIAVSAMEAVGVAQAMDSYNALSSTKFKIPYVFVRGNSDWLHNPVKELSNGTWTYTAPVSINFSEGYKYAIATTSNVVFSLMSERCKKLTPTNLAKSLCTYTISYS